MRVTNQQTPLFEATYDCEISYDCYMNFGWRSMSESFVGASRVGYIWQNLEFRSATLDGDEALCVSILCDFDLKKVQNTKIEDRTRTVWSMYDEIPAGVLFLPGEKLDDPGYTWALRRFVDCAVTGTPTAHPARLTPDGVRLELHGFVVQDPLQQNRVGVISISVGGRIYYIRQNLKRGNLSWQGLEFNKMGRLAVILGREPVDNLEDLPKLNACLGALVAIVNDSDNCLTVDYLRAVSVISQGSFFESTIVFEGDEKTLVVQAENTPAKQEWLIR
jgi:hypothetical protein